MGEKTPKTEETTLEVVSYDPQWRTLYEGEAGELTEVLGSMATAIEHFGSTSVPGLAAKPIVDILVGSSWSAPPTYKHLERLASLGYEYLGEDGRRPGRYFFRKRGKANFNLSIVPFDGVLWRGNLMVRDYLRSHPDEAELYAAVKRQGVEASPYSLLGYQNYKRVYMEEVKKRARQFFDEHGSN